MTILRIGHDQTVHDAYHFAATLLKEHLAGSIEEVRIVPDAGLGTEPEMLRKVIAGDLEVAIVTVANATGVIPELGFFSLPYLFADARHFERSISSPVFVQRLRALVERRCKDLEVIAIITPGVRNLYSVRPVESLDDLGRMRVRVMASAIDSDVWRSWGAEVIAYAVKSARTALQALEKCGNVKITRPNTEAFKLRSARMRRDVALCLGMTDLLDFLGASA